MTASLRRTVTVTVAALAVALLLVWSATVGPGQVIGDRHPATGAEHSAQRPASESDEVAEQVDSHDEDARREGTPIAWVQDLATFAVLLAGLLALGRVLQQVLLHIRRRLPGEQLVVPLEPLPDLHAARAAVERDEDRQRHALAGSDIRNGIVECWVVFEEAAAEADVARRPAETATELVVRFLHLLDVDPRPVGDLAHLFHEARFSTHPMATDARARAQGALARIHRDLAQTGAAT